MTQSFTVEEFEAECERLGGSFCKDMTEPLNECIEIVQEDIANNFRESMSSDGQRWPERKSGGAWPLLIKTGPLSDAATKRGAIGNVSRNDGTAIEVGVEKMPKGPGGLPGAFVHQHGYPENNIPARPYIGISDMAADICADVLGDFAVKQINE